MMYGAGAIYLSFLARSKQNCLWLYWHLLGESRNIHIRGSNERRVECVNIEATLTLLLSPYLQGCGLRCGSGNLVALRDYDETGLVEDESS